MFKLRLFDLKVLAKHSCLVLRERFGCAFYIYKLNQEEYVMNRLMLFSGLVVACFIVGCGSDAPPTVPVTGIVTLDGKPIEGATVNFLSENTSIAASGQTDAEGKFSIKTFIGANSVDGAIVGVHKVSVVKTESSGQNAPTDPEEIKKMMAEMTTNPAITSQIKSKAVIPEKYNNPTMSNLTATVSDAGPNNVVLELTSGK